MSACAAWRALQVKVCWASSSPRFWTLPQRRQTRKPSRGSANPANVTGCPPVPRRPKFISRNVAVSMYSKPNGVSEPVMA